MQIEVSIQLHKCMDYYLGQYLVALIKSFELYFHYILFGLAYKLFPHHLFV